jgi:RND family efflux transporter MFP subunit
MKMNAAVYFGSKPFKIGRYAPDPSEIVLMKPVYRKFVLIPGIVLVAVGAAVGLSQLKPEAPKRDDQPLDLLVEVLPLEVHTETFTIRSQGTVRPRTQTVLSAEVSGSIVSISPKFVAGGVFAQDEVLMRIDPSNYTVAVDKAEALVKQRQIEYDGARKLRSQGYRAESEYASAAAALASAQAELANARRNLERTSIRLPYEGIVLSKEADLGQFVNPGTRLGVTFATDVAEVRLALTDQDLAFVELPDASAVAKLGNGQGGPLVALSAVQKGKRTHWDAVIVRSEGVVDERSRVTYAVAQVRDPYRLHSEGAALPVGTFVSASIEGATVDNVIRIPRTALRGSDQVLVVDDENKIRIRTVNIVYADADYAYVDAGVVAGERITTTAIEAPVNGMSVRTTDSVADAEPGVGGGDALSRRAEGD